ncbi:MAG: hypothetical protein WAK15_08130 [Candidatus Cybelea sp.]
MTESARLGNFPLRHNYGLGGSMASRTLSVSQSAVLVSPAGS